MGEPLLCGGMVLPGERISTLKINTKLCGWIVMAAIHAAAQAPAPSTPVEIHVNLAKSEGPYRPIYNWFGYDEVNYTTAANGQLLLRELHDLSPVPVYIRAHHMLTSGDGVPELKWSSTNVFTLDSVEIGRAHV